ncbi:MAG: hypothetical protein IPO29_05805 [Anaerolineae bacterium]|nr:hypothetical protein [Anaerolineae bacterium]
MPALTQTAGLTTLNGTLSVPEAWLLGGALRGAGALNGNLTNAARVAPGNSAGALSVGKHYTQLPAGSLDIELGGTTPETSYDTLSVGGDAILSGTLNVTLVNARAREWQHLHFPDSSLTERRVLRRDRRGPGPAASAWPPSMAMTSRRWSCRGG